MGFRSLDLFFKCLGEYKRKHTTVKMSYGCVLVGDNPKNL